MEVWWANGNRGFFPGSRAMPCLPAASCVLCPVSCVCVGVACCQLSRPGRGHAMQALLRQQFEALDAEGGPLAIPDMDIKAVPPGPVRVRGARAEPCACASSEERHGHARTHPRTRVPCTRARAGVSAGCAGLAAVAALSVLLAVFSCTDGYSECGGCGGLGGRGLCLCASRPQVDRWPPPLAPCQRR